MNNTNTKRKINWMMDETIANSHPANWNKVRELEGRLVSLIGDPELEHEIIDPISCLRDMVKLLRGEQFSSVIDLTGWLTPAVQELFPNTPIENDFTLSRVRVVSSPRLETTGYRVSLNPEEVDRVRQSIDLRKPLIVDDVSFSGWTSRKTMDIFGMDPRHVAHAFLIANTGDLGDQKGAVNMLEADGSRVFFGKEIKTPQDDGWHLKDLHQNPNLEQSFILALLFQEAVKRDGVESGLPQNFFSQETVMRTIFPDHLTSDGIGNLIRDGRFALRDGNLIDGRQLHARNPFLWASPYFQDHIDIGSVLDNKDEVVGILTDLHFLTNDPEGKREASLELRREVQGFQQTLNPEGLNMDRRWRI